MKTMKVLNLYACLGGNRFKWDEVAELAGIKIEVTGVELDPEAARLYQERFPNDIVIVADAHQYST
jgi:DNA (cytosine-5)-methyltransferase 1